MDVRRFVLSFSANLGRYWIGKMNSHIRISMKYLSHTYLRSIRRNRKAIYFQPIISPGAPDTLDVVYNIPGEAVADEAVTLSVAFRANPAPVVLNWTLPGLSQPLEAGNLSLFESRAGYTNGRYSTDLQVEVRGLHVILKRLVRVFPYILL